MSCPSPQGLCFDLLTSGKFPYGGTVQVLQDKPAWRGKCFNVGPAIPVTTVFQVIPSGDTKKSAFSGGGTFGVDVICVAVSVLTVGT